MESVKRIRHKDRITLTASSLEWIKTALESLKSDLKGSKITRSELVNWILENKISDLSVSDRKNLIDKFFCPVKALEWAATEAKRLESEGSQVDINSLLDGVISTPNNRARRTAKKQNN